MRYMIGLLALWLSSTAHSQEHQVAMTWTPTDTTQQASPIPQSRIIPIPLLGASQEGFIQAPCSATTVQLCDWQWTLAVAPQGFNEQGQFLFIYRMTLLSETLAREEIQGVAAHAEPVTLDWHIFPYHAHLGFKTNLD